MRRYTRQLVHHHADYLRAAADFDAGGLFYENAESVVVIMGREVVEAVHEVEGLLVCEVLAEFFNATVDIAHVDVDFLYYLAVYSGAEPKHAVCGGVLRADVHHEVFFLEHAGFVLDDFALGVEGVHVGEVRLALVLDAYGVDVGVGVVVLAQGVSHPVDAEEEATHIGVVNEYYAEEVEYFALV